MKTAGIFAIALLLATSSFAQDKMVQELISLEAGDTTRVVEIEKEVIDVVEGVKRTEIELRSAPTSVDTTTIRFGKRKIVIIEKDGSTTVELPDRGETHRVEWDKDRDFSYKKKPKFKGHWAGFEWGFNGYLTPDHSANMTGDLRYLELRQGKSWNFNLNLFQQSIGFGTDKAGLVTGLGFEWNNYNFRNQSTITVNSEGNTVQNTFYIDNGYKVTKSRLQTTHLVVPLLFEFQIPVSSDKHRIFFSTGVIGGVRLGSNTKVVYDNVGEKTDKVKDDFNLSSFRYGVTARVGFRGLKFFANYYPTSLFEKGKGDEVYPFSVGLILLSFN